MGKWHKSKMYSEYIYKHVFNQSHYMYGICWCVNLHYFNQCRFVRLICADKKDGFDTSYTRILATAEMPYYKDGVLFYCGNKLRYNTYDNKYLYQCKHYSIDDFTDYLTADIAEFFSREVGNLLQKEQGDCNCRTDSECMTIRIKPSNTALVDVLIQNTIKEIRTRIARKLKDYAFKRCCCNV